MGVAGNILRTLAYAKRNGVQAAYYAAKERLTEYAREPYAFRGASEQELQAQREEYAAWREYADNYTLDYLSAEGYLPRISIIVPCYLTPKQFLQEMIESVLAQTYENWELILADASPQTAETDEKKAEGSEEAPVHVASLVYSLEDARIHYMKLKENKGISENTNRALEYATGDYIAFLDHDDLLTPDALFEVVRAIRENFLPLPESGMERVLSSQKVGGGVPPRRMMNPVGFVYTDEDKCEASENETMIFFDPNRKPAFNLDYLLSNNYICHFLVLRADLAKRLKLRSAYDGAQDYDLILRACDELMKESPAKERTLKALVQEVDDGFFGWKMHTGSVVHVAKVLYHWRSHSASSATNPNSKKYAYDAGRRAVEVFLREKGVIAKVSDLPHVGFYRVEYHPDALQQRGDIGAVGGRLLDEKGIVTGGAMREDGSVIYEGLRKGYSGGHLHRAVLQQEVAAVDIRNMSVSMRFAQRMEEIKLMDMETVKELLDLSKTDLQEGLSLDVLRSLLLCSEIRTAGYHILYDPMYENDD